jgi:hypothetical protein
MSFTFSPNTNIFNSNSAAITNTNPLSVYVTGGASAGASNTNIFNSNSTAITNTNPLSVYVTAGASNTNIFNSNGAAITNTNPIPVNVISGGANSYYYDFGLQVSRGLVANVTSLNVSGYLGSVSGTWIPLWDGGATAYVYPASAAQMRIWSSSASDTNISVTINGLDSSYNILTETITLTNGTTGVLSVNSYLRINSISSTTNAVGTISCGNSAKSVTYALIAIGNTKSNGTYYTVPNGYTFYFAQATVYTDQNGNQYSFYRAWTQNSGVTNVNVQFPIIGLYESRKVLPRAYVGKTDIQWQFQSSGTSRIGAQIEGYLVQGS